MYSKCPHVRVENPLECMSVIKEQLRKNQDALKKHTYLAIERAFSQTLKFFSQSKSLLGVTNTSV